MFVLCFSTHRVTFSLFLQTLWESALEGNDVLRADEGVGARLAAESNFLPVDALCLELRAGGASEAHEAEVRRRLGQLRQLDLLDFLAYLPLFIRTHAAILDDPLSLKPRRGLEHALEPLDLTKRSTPAGSRVASGGTATRLKNGELQ